MMMTILKSCSPIRPWCPLSAALAIIALLSVSHVTFAQQVDTKVYPGSSCEGNTRFGLDGGPLGQPRYLAEWGVVTNLSTIDHLEVVCPVVRDQTSGTAGIRAAFVRIFKATPAGGTGDVDFDCRLFSRDRFGTLVDTARASYSGAPANRILTLRPTPITSSDQSFPGYYFITCLLPVALAEEEEVGSEIIDCTPTQPNCPITSKTHSFLISYRVDEIRSSQAEAQELGDEEM